MAAHGLVHIMELTYPALLSRIEAEFDLRVVITGAIATAFGWAFGSSAIPAGFLVDRIGTRRVLVYSFGLAAVMATLVGLSLNAWFFSASLFGLGIAIGLYHPAGLSLMAQGVERRGIALGWHGVSGNVGQAMAPAIAVTLAIAIDWRAAFFFVAALAAVLAVVLAGTRLNVQEGSEVAPVSPLDSSSGPDADESQRSTSLAPLLLVYAAFVVSGMVYRGAITYLPSHMEEMVNEDFGAAFVTVALLMGAVGQLVGGAMSQRYALERLAPVFGLLAIPALILTGLASGWVLVAISSAFVFFYFAAQPVWTGLIADYSPPGAVGRSYGVSFFAGFGLGSLGGVIAGALVDEFDTGAAFLGLSILMGVALVIALTLMVMAERRRVAVAGELRARTS